MYEGKERRGVTDKKNKAANGICTYHSLHTKSRNCASFGTRASQDTWSKRLFSSDPFVSSFSLLPAQRTQALRACVDRQIDPRPEVWPARKSSSHPHHRAPLLFGHGLSAAFVKNASKHRANYCTSALLFVLASKSVGYRLPLMV